MKNSPSNTPQPSWNRRQFIKAAGASMVFPFILPGCSKQQELEQKQEKQKAQRPRPSNRVTMGVIGWGMQGPSDTKSFLAETDCQVVAACDIDKTHLKSAVDTINQHYQNQDCKSYHDYRELIARDDIDAILVAVPDHWHALVAIEAAKKQKDIYCEKPLAFSIGEQQAIVRAVQQNQVIWQTGSWQRSGATFRKAAEIVRNGLIGEVTKVEVGLPSGHTDFAGTRSEDAIASPPEELDFERWIGPSRMEPYIKARVHKNWRWNYNTGGGQLLDWVGHHCDIAHWGMGWDNSGPSEVEGKGEFPPQNAVWNTCTKYRLELKYPAGVTMTMAGGYSDIRSGAKWIGKDGWVWVDRSGFEGSNPDWKKTANLPDELRKVQLYASKSHYRNFLDCVKSGQPTITPVETAHHSAIPGHLGLISMLLGRKIRWDVAKEVILGDLEATALMNRRYRDPWRLS